ncbi:MAG: ABC transporter permease [Eubacterium sp.]|nr:ABC transporter permease [Eubacterium sp.]
MDFSNDRIIQNRFILSELIKKGIRLKYRRSYLGILWSLLEPLLTMVVLTIVFGTLMGEHDKAFPVYILTGRLLYGFFAQSTTAALKSIRANSSIIKKVYVPKMLYPLSAILFNFIIFLISLIVLAVVAIVLGVMPTLYVFQAVPVLIVLLILSLGIGIILSTVGVFFRDMEYLWTIALMLIMYTSAIFYRADRLLGSRWSFILKMNPLFSVIECFRSAVFGEWLNVHYLLYAAAFGIICIIIGVIAFKKNEDKFILEI